MDEEKLEAVILVKAFSEGTNKIALRFLMRSVVDFPDFQCNFRYTIWCNYLMLDSGKKRGNPPLYFSCSCNSFRMRLDVAELTVVPSSFKKVTLHMLVPVL